MSPGDRKQYREARSAAEARERFVWIDDAGTARELSPEECEYLARPFDPTDGGRPYVKERYDTRTPDNRLLGYLERRNLPWRMKVRPYEPPIDPGGDA